MQFVPKKSIKKFQLGGTVAPEEEVPMTEEAPVEEGVPEGDQNPLIILALGAMQALQNQDCQIAMQVCQGLVQVLQSAQQAPPEQGAPVYRKGGILVRRIKK